MLLNKLRSTDRPAPRAGRKLAAAAVAVAATVAMAGCTSGGDSGTAVVKWLSWDDAAVMQPIIDAFEAEHPEIDIQISNVADVTQYQSTLQPQLLAGTAPDLFILGSKTEQVGGGYVLDLSDEAFAENLSSANVSYASFEGKLYGVSISSWGGGIVVNTDILAEVGVNGLDDWPTSWDGFLDLLGELQDAGHTPLYESGTGGVSNTLCALLGIDNEREGGDLDAQVFAGETTWAETTTESYEQWMRIFDEGYETRDVVGLAGDVINQEFAQGNVAMIGTGTWAMGQLNDLEAPFEMSFYPVPGIEEGTSYMCGAASPAIAVNAASEVKEEALAFLEFFTSPEAGALYNAESGNIVTTVGTENVVDPALENIVETVQSGKVYLPIVNWPQYQDALDAESIVLLQQMIGGQIEPGAVPAGLDAKLKELQG